MNIQTRIVTFWLSISRIAKIVKHNKSLVLSGLVAGSSLLYAYRSSGLNEYMRHHDTEFVTIGLYALSHAALQYIESHKYNHVDHDVGICEFKYRHNLLIRSVEAPVAKEVNEDAFLACSSLEKLIFLK